MSLQENLDAIQAASKSRVPPETQAIMQRSIDDLRASGILGRILKAGDRAPAFTLPATAGQPVSSDALLARGPMVVSFFRGRW
jgi:hypothetical protein